MERINIMSLVKPRETVTPADLRQICLRDVFAYVYRRVPRVEDAEDITAEVFALALNRIPSHVHEPKAWLIGVARRKVADFLRRYGCPTRPLLNDELTVEGPHSEVERRESAKHLIALVDELPEEQREALILQCADNLSLNEISVVMKRSVPSVKGLLQRARQTIYDRGSAYFLEHQEVQA